MDIKMFIKNELTEISPYPCLLPTCLKISQEISPFISPLYVAFLYI